MNFHLGKPILVMLVIAAAGGLAVTLRAEPEEGRPHRLGLRRLAPQVVSAAHPSSSRSSTTSTSTSTSSSPARWTSACTSLFMADPSERGDARPGRDRDRLDRPVLPPAGRRGRLPAAERPPRRSPAGATRSSKQRLRRGRRRADLRHAARRPSRAPSPIATTSSREAGVDLTQAKTWPQFHEACLKFEHYWRAAGLQASPRAGTAGVVQRFLQVDAAPARHQPDRQLRQRSSSTTRASRRRSPSTRRWSPGRARSRRKAAGGDRRAASRTSSRETCAASSPRTGGVTYFKRYGAADQPGRCA